MVVSVLGVFMKNKKAFADTETTRSKAHALILGVGGYVTMIVISSRAYIC